ncbi:MAG TPA: hypothetical protein VF369_04880 [candidate division Zixibacteria bacterium]
MTIMIIDVSRIRVELGGYGIETFSLAADDLSKNRNADAGDLGALKVKG